MPVLTADQLAEIRQIVDDASKALAISIHGHEVPDTEIQRLADLGYLDPDNLGDMTLDAITHGALTGRVSEVRDMSWADFQRHLKANPYAPGPVERMALTTARARAGVLCVGLGNRWNAKLGTIEIEADAKLDAAMRSIIKDETAKAVLQRRSIGQLTSDFKQATEDWGRDWGRIANTEIHQVHQEGYLYDMVDQYGEEELMAKIPNPDACSACKAAYLENGKPKIRPLSWWLANGTTNVGRKGADRLPVTGTFHPNCFCENQRVPKGWGFTDAWELVPDPETWDADDEGAEKSLTPGNLVKAGGPFIGPRGGKWADAAHKIPWSVDVDVHHKIFGNADKHTYHVTNLGNDHVKVSRYERDGHGPVMHKDSLPHFVNDLAGKVDVPKHSRPEIAAVASGKAKFLGKGDDGLAFRVGDNVVKVSTTVPYQPDNPGHRTPQEAVSMLRKQSKMGNRLADLGIPGIQRSEFIEHGGKGFQIKPYVTIPDKFTREQLDKIQDIVLAVHEAGYAIKDAIQAGLDDKGNVVMFDVGKAGKQSDATGIYSDVRVDHDAMARLYRDSGQTYVRRGQSQGEEALEKLKGFWDKWMSGNKKSKFMEFNLNNVVRTLKREASATLSGAKLEARIKEIDKDTQWMRDEIWVKGKEEEEAEGKTVKKSTPTYSIVWRDAEGNVVPEEVLAKAHRLQGRMNFQGIQISIENRRGSRRHWRDPGSGETGSTKMKFAYGYIRGAAAKGKDGDCLDCFIGPNPEATNAYVIHQTNAPRFTGWDEDKIMLGWNTAAEAKKAYLDHYNDPRFFGSMTTIPMHEFKRKVLETRKSPNAMVKSYASLVSHGQRLAKGESYANPKDMRPVGSGGMMMDGSGKEARSVSSRGYNLPMDVSRFMEMVEDAVKDSAITDRPRIKLDPRDLNPSMFEVMPPGQRPIMDAFDAVRGNPGKVRNTRLNRERVEQRGRECIRGQEVARDMNWGRTPKA